MTLLDTGSPQTFIPRHGFDRMLWVGAASAACERPCSPRAWGGFGESSPLRASTSILLSLHFFRNDEPTIFLAVWACVVPPSVMQHAVLLDCNSWMRFNTLSYRALPPRPRDVRRADVIPPRHDRRVDIICHRPPQLQTVVSISSMMALGVSTCGRASAS